ncbi:MAG: hypothetical protein CM1200mP30_31950 [Pseudomonadota bacterium]|nr:MAG: hypothetical protein CM1200mP30_31950 [Pseudomonadota bacterium]
MFTEENKNLLIEALSYIKRFNGKIVVVKYGGASMIEDISNKTLPRILSCFSPSECFQ